MRARIVWVDSPGATRHALALWVCTGKVWTTRAVLPLWRKWAGGEQTSDE